MIKKTNGSEVREQGLPALSVECKRTAPLLNRSIPGSITQRSQGCESKGEKKRSCAIFCTYILLLFFFCSRLG